MFLTKKEYNVFLLNLLVYWIYPVCVSGSDSSNINILYKLKISPSIGKVNLLQ